MKELQWVARIALLAALAAPAWAQGPVEVRRQTQASMVLTGQVRIAADGRAESVSIDRESEVPAEVVQLLRGAAQRWRFEPAAAGAAADTAMSVRVGLRRAEDGQAMTMRVVSASFGDQARVHPSLSVSMPPPKFPNSAMAARMPATTYVVLRFGRDGKVDDAFIEQVNLYAIGSEKQMQWFRRLFADASLAAARKWRFAPPTQGPEAGHDSWRVRVPVDFRFLGDKSAGYGQWDVYVPGPRQYAPWTNQERDAGVDAVADTSPRLVGAGRRLLSALDNGG